MITKETFKCGNNTLVGLSAKEVLEFLFSRNVGCGYHLVTDYLNVGFSKPSVWDDKRNIINYTLTAGKITKSSISLNSDYADEIFKGD